MDKASEKHELENKKVNTRWGTTNSYCGRSCSGEHSRERWLTDVDKKRSISVTYNGSWFTGSTLAAIPDRTHGSWEEARKVVNQ